MKKAIEILNCKIFTKDDSGIQKNATLKLTQLRGFFFFTFSEAKDEK